MLADAGNGSWGKMVVEEEERETSRSTSDDLSSPYKISSHGVSDHGKEIIWEDLPEVEWHQDKGLPGGGINITKWNHILLLG